MIVLVDRRTLRRKQVGQLGNIHHILRFSLVSVCSGWSPCDHYPWCIRPQCTAPLPHISDMGPLPGPPQPHSPDTPPDITHGTQPQASDIWWSSLETCSDLFIWRPTPIGTEIWWPKQQMSGRWYASYWNALLPSATKLRRLCFYTSLSVHKGGVCLSACRDTTPPQQTAIVADGTHPTGVHSSCL